jgi:hypothetical protein
MTNKQLTMIHVLMHKAWDAHVYEVGGNNFANSKAADTWRRDELEKLCGKRSTKELTETQFEDAMLHFGIIAQDMGVINHFSGAAERRYRWQLHRFMRLVQDVRGEAVGWSYVRSIMDRMILPESMDDMTVLQLGNVLAALDTHYRRLVDRLAPNLHTDGPTELRRHLEADKPGLREHALQRLAHARKAAGMEPSRSPTPEVAHIMRDLQHGHVAAI